MKQLIIPTITLLVGATSAYAFLPSYTPEQLAERENKQTIKRCINSISYDDTVDKIQRAIETCKELELIKVITPKVEKSTTTGSVMPEASQGYTKKHSLVLTGSHDYRIYSDRKGAVWKNNNPSGLTWGISPTLKLIWEENGIKYERGTLRPINEGGNYIRFLTIEDGLRAKLISIRDRHGKSNVGRFLSTWGTDDIKLSFSKSKIISELTDQEFSELFIQQLKKESPGLVSQLVKDGILIVE